MSGATTALATEARISSRLGNPRALEITLRPVLVDARGSSPETVDTFTLTIPLFGSRFGLDRLEASGLLAELEALRRSATADPEPAARS